jgi:hypothetical protein
MDHGHWHGVAVIASCSSLQVTSEVDVFVSHDWPRGIAEYGDTRGAALLCEPPR